MRGSQLSQVTDKVQETPHPNEDYLPNLELKHEIPAVQERKKKTKELK